MFFEGVQPKRSILRAKMPAAAASAASKVESQSPESLSLSFWFHPEPKQPVISQEMALDLLRERLAAPICIILYLSTSLMSSLAYR